MSLKKPIKVILVALTLFALLLVVASQFLGPGVGDFADPIINGYEYNYAGGNEINIVYTGNERSKQIVIDSRVDEYKVDGDRLLVARRPREIYRTDDGVTRTRLSSICEYWIININTHQVEMTPKSRDVACK
ncbi:MAG: hypothetical protein H0W44_04615 [Gammaproteobacteria bacterium]|nr:hypothetical protein [Gammaproteobacteria bacterium]